MKKPEAKMSIIVRYISTVADVMRNVSKQSSKPTTFIGIHELVLVNGKFMPTGPFPKGLRRGKMGECFYNAFRLTMDNPRRFVYVEGYACGKIPLPLEHGWVWDRKLGKVLDPTWNESTEYYGIPFKWDFVCRTVVDRKRYGVIDNMEQNFPLLRLPELIKSVVETQLDMPRVRLSKVKSQTQGWVDVIRGMKP